MWIQTEVLRQGKEQEMINLDKVSRIDLYVPGSRDYKWAQINFKDVGSWHFQNGKDALPVMELLKKLVQIKTISKEGKLKDQ